MALSHWFLPDKHTHKKATLINWEGLLIYILLFLLLHTTFSLVSYLKPGVLGITSQVDSTKIIELTNSERQKQGLSVLQENEVLKKAALAKAQDMFSENYWAHFSPSGKSPWDFMLGAGYKFSFAGENLAKNFYNSEDVVAAWMASPTHKENIVNSKYQEIGIAVVEGVLNGQNTTLVVQMFGTTNPQAVAQNPQVEVGGETLTLSKQDLEKQFLPQIAGNSGQASFVPQTLIDPFQTSKVLGFSVIGLMITLLIVDFMALRKRGVFRITSHYSAHFALLSATALALVNSTPGSIL